MYTLDDYQLVSWNFLLSKGKFACLFDEPGVGKTGPAIMAAWNKRYREGSKDPILVTCPAYLVSNWRREIKNFVPQAVVNILEGSPKNKRSILQKSIADFVIISYNTWILYPVSDRKWSVMVFDEAHRMRKQGKVTTEVVKQRNATALNKETPMYLLTGTPFVRDGGDFFTYFKLFDRKKYPGYWKFVNEKCVVVENPWTTDVGNIRKDHTDAFQEELSQFSMRRTVKEIPKLQSLEFVESEHFVTMPKSVLKAIREAKKTYRMAHEDMEEDKVFTGAGALYVAQRQIATNPPTKENPKLEWLKDFAQDTDKAVVYTWFKNSARNVYDAINTPKRKAYLVTGDLSAPKRDEVVEEWRADPTGILVATIPALKEGVSLVEAHKVVFLESSELPADREQCIKRLCRRGQTKVVEVYNVYAEGTVDMAIRRVVNNRHLGIAQVFDHWMNAEED